MTNKRQSAIIVLGGGKVKVSKYFTSKELNCKCSKCKNKEIPKEVLVNLKKVAVELDKLRDHVGKPIFVNSAYRCRDHNKAVGGVSDSAHVQGYAIDFHINGMTEEEMFTCASGLDYKQAGKSKPKTNFSGVGYYPNRNFCHVDVKFTSPRPNTWRG